MLNILRVALKSYTHSEKFRDRRKQKRIILLRSARQCFNARPFTERMDIDFSGSYDKTVKQDPAREQLCGEKGVVHHTIR